MADYLYSPLYSELSILVGDYQRFLKSNDPVTNRLADQREDKIKDLVWNHLPHGSGYDSGTKIDLDCSHADKLVFNTSFHHMDSNGFYDGWTEHTIIVIPSLSREFHLRITGKNRNDIKSMIHDDFSYSLKKNVKWDIVQDYPVTKERGIEVKSEWIDESRQRWFVVEKDKEIFTPTPREDGVFLVNPVEACQAFAVKYIMDRGWEK